MVFRYFRERIFAFSGAYALVVFYNNAQNELSDPKTGKAMKSKLKINPPKQEEHSNLLYALVPPFMSSYGNNPVNVRDKFAPIARPSDDAQYLVVEYDVNTAFVMGILILAGGWFAIGGAAAAIVLECSQEGPQTYEDIKDTLRTRRNEIEG